MVTTIPQIKVTRVDAAGGFLVTCDRCPGWRHLRGSRLTADELALDHQRSHGRIDPADHVPDLAGWPA